MQSEEPFSENIHKKYFDHYKKLDQVNEENKFYSIDESCFTEFLNSFKEQGIIPSKLGIIKENGEKDKLQINKMRFGDNYIRSLSRGINKTTYIKDFQLSHNRITNKSSEELLRNIPMHTSNLDLSYNKIGIIGVKNLSDNLLNPNCRIISINLEDNQLRDRSASKLLNSLSQNQSLKYLNLSKNILTDDISDSMINLLEKSFVEEIYLHWNTLKQGFGNKIFKQLQQNKYVRVLDLSNNLISKIEGNSNCIQEICQFFEKNTAIVHLDLSFNNFNYTQSQELSISLQKNTSIYGIHYMGNCGYIDDRGFLIPEMISQSLEKNLHKRIDGVKFVQTIGRDKFRDNQLRDCCWICQGWNQLEIVWTDGKSLQRKLENLFIHFNFLNFNQIYLGQLDQFQHIYTYMVPPGENRFFFSDQYANFFPADDLPKINQYQSIQNIKIYDQSQHKALLNDIHMVEFLPNKSLINKKEDYTATVEVKPRNPYLDYDLPKDSVKNFQWHVSVSLMCNWRPDDAELINLCFNYDWECGKISKIIKDPVQLSMVKNFFRARYKFIKDSYKYYSTWNPVGDIWAIQAPQYMEFINKCKLIDSQVTLEFLIVKFTAVLSGQKTQAQIPAIQLLNLPELKQSIYNHDVERVDSYELPEKPQVQNTQEVQKKNVKLKFLNQPIQTQTILEEDEQDIIKVPEISKTNVPETSKNIENTKIVDSNRGAVKTKTFLQRIPDNNSKKLQPLRRSSFIQDIVKVINTTQQQQQISQLYFNKSPKISSNIIKKHLYQLSRQPIDHQGIINNKNPRNPERGVNRYQFLELILRIAEEKYINQYQITKNYYDAVCMIWEEHLFQDFKNYDTQPWRKERYFTEDVDACLKYYKKLIDHVYKKNAVKKVRPGQLPFMSLDEFSSIIGATGLNEMEGVASNLHLPSFNNSMQTQIDELWVDRIFQMNIYEFYEALARVAEEASFPPLKGCQIEVETQQQRQILPLAYKLEGLISRLYQFCCDAQFKSNFQFPEKSIFAAENEELKQNIFKIFCKI